MVFISSSARDRRRKVLQSPFHQQSPIQISLAEGECLMFSKSILGETNDRAPNRPVRFFVVFKRL